MTSLRSYIIFIFLILSAFESISQFDLKKKADEEFDKMRYMNAIDLYDQYLAHHTSDRTVQFKLASSYQKIGNTVEAENALRALIGMTQPSTTTTLFFAQVLAENKKYEESASWYAKYKALQSSDSRGSGFNDAYKSLAKFYMDSSSYKLFSLNLNSPQSDFSPAYYDKGIVFCSGRQKEQGVRSVFGWNNSAFLNLYYVDTVYLKRKIENANDRRVASLKHNIYYDETQVTSNDTQTVGYYSETFSADPAFKVLAEGTVKEFSHQLNSKYHEGPVVFAKDGKTIYFTRNNFYQGKYNESNEGVNKLILLKATKQKNGEWGKVVGLPFNNPNYSVGHPALSANDSVLYFSSDKPSGFGGSDMYQSVMNKKGVWGQPENMGADINTEGNERFPFVDAQGNFYFSSDGHSGLGGLDVFKTNLKEKRVVNVGAPINSSVDDFGFIINETGTSGYFSSNRKRSGSDDDIFYFTYKPSLTESVVMDKRTGKSIDGAMLELVDLTTGNASSQSISAAGSYQLSTTPCHEYRLTTRKLGYPDVTKQFKSACSAVDRQVIKVEMAQYALDGSVLDINTRQPLSFAKINFVDVTDGNKQDTVSTKADGKFYFQVIPCHEYKITTTKNGYPTKEDRINVPCSSEADPSVRILFGVLKKGCVELFVVNEKTKVGVDSVIVLLLDKNGNEFLRSTTDKNGKAIVCDLPKDGMKVTALKRSYFTINTAVEASEYKQGDPKVIIELPPLLSGITFELEGILYDLGKFNIRTDAAKVLDMVVKVMNENPTLEIELSAHTDARGSDPSNLSLSDSRAKAAAAYVISKGIDVKRVTGKGFGESQLKNKCTNGIKCSEKEHRGEDCEVLICKVRSSFTAGGELNPQPLLLRIYKCLIHKQKFSYEIIEISTQYFPIKLNCLDVINM
jgi:outer membrane protein OmpA-like peptidoglycan-associated protein/tetratricopeptide (TPR) repeat protein